MRSARRLPLDAIAPYRLAGTGPLDLATTFGNAAPVELEVGLGKGAFLVDAALRRPETNWLGIEIDRGLEMYVASRIARRWLANVRVTGGDATRILRDRIAAGALAAIHVYFPDPWWKRRHRKRRIWSAEFASECERVLPAGGRLHIATDVGEYDTVIRRLLDGRPALTRLSATERTGTPGADELLTNFERKALIKGGTVWRAEYERKAGHGSEE